MASDLTPGFADPVIDAQASFRAILDAIAYPGRPRTLDRLAAPPSPLAPATAAVALTLFDFETPVWLDAAATASAEWLRFHCGCPIVADPAEAAFAVAAAGPPALDHFAIGTDAYPDRSATLVVQVPAIAGGPALRLRGPGIKGEGRLEVTGLPADFPALWAANRALAPLGVDLILCADRSVIGLPRTTEVLPCMSR